MTESWIKPNWSVSARVHALSTTRVGGVSEGSFASLNLGAHVGDDPQSVAANRQWLEEAASLPAAPLWLEQIHSAQVVEAGSVLAASNPPQADAVVARRPGQVCAIMTADCLPVLFSTSAGDQVAAAHAGWRGLAAGVLTATVQALACAASDVHCWLGPAIGPQAFEVGSEVREAFVSRQTQAVDCFSAKGERWFCDLYALARLELRALGVQEISGGEYCTWSEPERFFSYRRDGQCGRMASLIWLE